MAKTKHQKLADKMQAMLTAIDEHNTKVAKQLSLVQLYFFEPYASLDRPLMTESALRGMFVTHYLNLRILAQDPSLRTICRELPMLGTILQRPFRLLSEFRKAGNEGMWVVPWKVKMVLPGKNHSKLERSREQALLYCPEPEEISNEIDWFEQDMARDSLTHLILSSHEYERRNAILRTNLCQNPSPIWERAKEKWKEGPTEEDDPNVMHDVAENPSHVDDVDFAPQKGMSLALAYELLMNSTRAHSFRHRQSLRICYKQELEQAMFMNVSFSETEKIAFLQQWWDLFFETKTPSGCKRPGRWKSCEGVDDVLASRFIKHFVSDFISEPNSKKSGEIACVLWILLWIAQEHEGNHIGIRQVLQLTSQDIVSNNNSIMIGGTEVTISWGLREFLLCLRGKGEGKRAHRLFDNLDTSGKALERALIQASKDLLGNNAAPVLPGAFLVSPHCYQGIRMSSAQRKAMRKARSIVPFRNTRNEIKKELFKEQERHSISV